MLSELPIKAYVRTFSVTRMTSIATRVVTFGLISLIYFTDMFLRASRKVFWFDELYTVYLCRLPTFRDTWTAVLHGADFNPPLFYLLTRASQWFFGEGLIATRLPAILGCWVFGVSLFIFVSRRTGRPSGTIAALFPFFTLAQYYAYEARAHGIVLGWCGLALVCWQRAGDGRARHLWQTAFGLSVLCAMMTHVYAAFMLVPFALAELYEIWSKRRVNWGILAVTIVAAAISLPIYLIQSRAFRATGSLGGLSMTLEDAVQHFLVVVLGPASVVLLLAIGLAAMNWRRVDSAAPSGPVPARDLIVAAGFACIPLFGLVAVKLTNGPFFNRYFLSATAGYAMLLGFASAKHRARSVAPILAGGMVLLLLGDLAVAVRHWKIGQEDGLVEPSSKFAFGTGPAEAMDNNENLIAAARQQDVLVLREPDYLYFFRYAPADVERRLYFGAPAEDDFFLRCYRRLATWAHLDLRLTTFQHFFADHRHFYVYGSRNGELSPPQCGDCVQTFLDAGYAIDSIEYDGDGILYEYEK